MLLLVGLALLAAGGWVLWSPRAKAVDREPAQPSPDLPPQPDTLPDPAPSVARQILASQPSRLVLGLVLLVLGFHCIAWALPDDWIPTKVPVRNWHLLLGICGVLVVLSVLIDRFEQSLLNDDSSTD